MDDKKKKIIIISIVSVLVVTLIGLIVAMVAFSKKPQNNEPVVEVFSESVEEVDKFLDVLCVEESLKAQGEIIKDDIGTDISEKQKDILLEIGVPEEDISGFKVYSAQELLDIKLILDEREIKEEMASTSTSEENDTEKEKQENAREIYFHTEEEAKEILKSNENKEESKKYIDSMGRYVVTKSEEYIINKTTKVVFLAKPRDEKYAREILIKGISPQDLFLTNSNEEADEEQQEQEKSAEETIKTEAYLTKVSSLKYKVELKYPEDATEKKYSFYNGIVEVPNVEQQLQEEMQQVADTLEQEQENMLSVGTESVAIEKNEQEYITYKDTFILDENGIITTKYIDKDGEEHEENIVIDFIKFSTPTCTSTADQIIFSNIDKEDKKTAIYQIAKLDVNIDGMTEEQIKEAEDSIKKDEVKETLVFSEEIISNTIDYATLENGIYAVRFRISANNQKNIKDSSIIEISFHKTNGAVGEVTEIEQEGNFRLRYVSINGSALSESKLNELMDNGKVTIKIKSSINKVTITAEAEDPEATIVGTGTIPVEPTTKTLTINSKGQTKKVYIILRREEVQSGNGNNGGSGSSGGSNGGSAHTHSFGAWRNNGDGGEIRSCSCGETETRGHGKLVYATKTPGTCTQNEVRIGGCPNGCGYSREETGNKNLSNHAGYGVNSKVTTQPTCGKEGITTYTCKGCNGFRGTDKIAKLNHEYAYETGNCKYCGTPIELPKNVSISVRRGDRTRNGYYLPTSVTKNGQKVNGIQFVINGISNPNDYKGVKVWYDCGGNVRNNLWQDDGDKSHCSITMAFGSGDLWLKVYIGDRMVAKYDSFKFCINHKQVPATCNEPVHCTICGARWGDPTGNHSWNSGEVTKKATCTEKGIRTYTCTQCQTKKPEPINSLGHIPSDWRNAGDPSCHHKICTREDCEFNVDADHILGKYLDKQYHNWQHDSFSIGTILNGGTVPVNVKCKTCGYIPTVKHLIVNNNGKPYCYTCRKYM